MKEKLKRGKPVLLVFLLAAVVAWAGYTGYWLYQANQLISQVEDETLRAELSLWQVRSDLQTLDSKSVFFAEDLEIIAINEEGRYVYRDHISEDIVDDIDTWKEGFSTFIRVREGDIENIMEYKWNGDLYIDGNKVGAG